MGLKSLIIKPAIGEALQEYKRAKREAVLDISKPQGEALDILYQKLGAREVRKEMFKLAQVREKIQT